MATINPTTEVLPGRGIVVTWGPFTESDTITAWEGWDCADKCFQVTVNSTTLKGIYNASRAAFNAAGVPYIDKPNYYKSYAAEHAAGLDYDGVHFKDVGYQDEANNIMTPAIIALRAA